jgi:hypothetical protein
LRAKLSGQQPIDWTSANRDRVRSRIRTLEKYMRKTTSIAKKAVHISTPIGSAKKYTIKECVFKQH